MNYKVVVGGGITGAVKSYEGDVMMDTKEKQALFSALKKEIMPKNPQLRDGFSYQITVEGDGEYFQSNYDDSNIPKTVLEFVHKIGSLSR